MNEPAIRQRLRQLFAGAAVRADDALRSSRAVIGSIPLIANALVSATGKRVQIRRAQPGVAGATDGNTIYLMDLPVPGNAADVDTFTHMTALAYGLLHHELGHVNHTDFNARAEMHQLGAPPLAMHLLGCIEDVRQENAYIRRFPAAKPYLDALNEALQLTRFWAPIPDDAVPAQVLSGYLLYRLYHEYRGDKGTAELARQAEDLARRTLPPGVMMRLDLMLPRVKELRNTLDAGDLACDIASMLQEEAEKERQAAQQPAADPQTGDGEDQDASGTDSNAGAGTDQDDEGSEGDQGPSDTGGDAGKDQGDSATDSNAGGGDDSGASGANGNASIGERGAGASPDQRQNLEQIVKGEDVDQAHGDRGEAITQALWEAIRSAHQDCTDGTLSVAGEHMDADIDGPGDDSELYLSPGLFEPGQALSVTGALRRKLLRELQAETEADIHIGRRGRRLSGSHLHRVATGDNRIFRTEDEEIDTNAAVALVLDVSGSMNEPATVMHRRIELAAPAVYATAVAMEAIAGVEVAVATFPFFAVVKDFGRTARRQADRFQLAVGGSTPMAEGIVLGSRLLAQSTKRRKLLIVMTDGEPDNAATAGAMIAAAEQQGCEVYGLGIAPDAMQNIFPRWQSISDLSQLPETLTGLLKQRLLQQVA